MPKRTLFKIKPWIIAIRPKTLPAAVGPVAVGSAAAAGDQMFAFIPAMACLAGSLLLQITVNLANDYFDFVNHIDSEKRLGPVRVTQSGLIAPHAVKMGMMFSLFLAGLVFAYLVYIGGIPIFITGIACVLAALGYSGGPWPIASNGLGDLFVFIFFGLVAVCGTYFIQAGQLTAMAMLAAIPPGLLITAIMVVNNLRDIETDRKAGKKTLAVILGPKKTILEYKFLLLISYFMPPALFFSGLAGPRILLPLLTIPLAWKLNKSIEREQGASLNDLLAGTAKLSLLFSLLFAAGLL